jgi:hypothetical protein
MSGYIFFINGSPISWKSKLQPTVALSTTEAEYMALSLAVQECLFLKKVLSEMNLAQSSTTMYCDNQGAIHLSKNEKTNARTKHINIRHHFIKDAVSRMEIDVCYIPTEEMLADPLTKALDRKTLEHFRLQSGIVHSTLSRASEGVESQLC